MVKIIRSMVFIILLVDLTGCSVLSMIFEHPTLQRWQSKRIRAEYDKEYEAFMAKKTPEERQLYLENRDICFDVATEKKETEGKHFNIYHDDCMEERGTPGFKLN